MAILMRMPKIGVNMTEGTILQWEIQEGEFVREGDHILTAETDKAAQEIYASGSGVLVKHLAAVGQVVLCQEPIAVIAEKGETVAEADIEALITDLGIQESKVTESDRHQDATSGSHFDSVRESEQIPSEGAGSEVSPAAARVKISPLARKAAEQLGIDYRLIPPAQPGARITQEDVEAYMKGNSAPAHAQVRPADELVVERLIPLSGIRKAIADKMTMSITTIPRAQLNVRANAGHLIELRESTLKNGNKVGFSALLVKAAAMCLAKHPVLNSRLRGNNVALLHDINIGVAVDTERGLMVPVIHRAGTKGIAEINQELLEKTARARSAGLTSEDIANGTFTITNLGMIGIEQFFPVINPPQCAILAVGAFAREPAAEEQADTVTIKTRFWLSLAFDHRIVDGAPAGRFLMDLKRIIECPSAIAG